MSVLAVARRFGERAAGAVVAPQRVVANAEFPYRERIEQARRQLRRMGIADVKPLYCAAARGASGASPVAAS